MFKYQEIFGKLQQDSSLIFHRWVDLNMDFFFHNIHLGKEMLINESTSQNADHLQGEVGEVTEVQKWGSTKLCFRFSSQ